MTGEPSDVEGYLAGDPRSFGEVDGWIRRELRIRYRSLHHEHEDLAQTIHEKLLVSLRAARFHGQSTLRSYVTGIAHHSAIDRLRSRYRDRALTETVAPPDNPGGGNPYDTIEARDNLRLLHQVVQALPEGCRDLWKMVLVDRLTYEEIGGRLSIPPGTVKSRMWHCRRKASALLERFRRAPRAGPK